MTATGAKEAMTFGVNDTPAPLFALPPSIWDASRVATISKNNRVALQMQSVCAMSIPPTPIWPSDEVGIPNIVGDESFGDLADKLSQFVLQS